MSVAIDINMGGQFDKRLYDAEFDVESYSITDETEEEQLGPAQMCWITCLVTGL